ncbi:MAG: hypothetical protein JWM20_279 [Patescibacteria group bacterium]|nr:hypothetical protein [Patescibacteria group bacterium]
MSSGTSTATPATGTGTQLQIRVTKVYESTREGYGKNVHYLTRVDTNKDGERYYVQSNDKDPKIRTDRRISVKETGQEFNSQPIVEIAV